MKLKKAEAFLHPTMCEYLGHFKQARYMREGHNTNAVLAPDGHRVDGTRVDHVPGQEGRWENDMARLASGPQKGPTSGPGSWGYHVDPGVQSTIQPFKPSLGTIGSTSPGTYTPIGNSAPTATIGIPKPVSFVDQINLYKPRTFYV
jgi:hypothetical protein